MLRTDVFQFDVYGKHYVAKGTVAPVLKALQKRIKEILPSFSSVSSGYTYNAFLFDSLTAEFMRHVREGIVAGLIVEEPVTEWTSVFESENMIIKRKAA